MGQAILLATFPPHLQPAALVMWGVGAVFGPVRRPDPGQHRDRGLQLARRLLHDRAARHLRAGLHLVRARRAHASARPCSFDWIGFIALSVAIVAAQLIFDRGQRLDWFEFDARSCCAPSSARWPSGSSSRIA